MNRLFYVFLFDEMDVFYSLKSFVRPDIVCIDNIAFRICTKVAFTVLLGASLVVTARQFIGDPIDCIVDGIPDRIMDTYCWFYSTFTLKNRLIGTVGRDLIQPGVASDSEFDDTIKYHRYYQWVCFVLFFQAILCYMPRYIWKQFEGGRISMLSQDLRNPVLETATKHKRQLAAVNYIKENLNRHTFYAYRFFLCECFNVGIAIGQFYITDYFLDGEFWFYGFDILQSTEMDANPMARVFPKMTKCTFHKYGPSGSIQKYDGLCVLPVNNFNEKIYLFLWFWMIFMVFVSGIALIYRIIVLLVSCLRLNLLRIRGRMASPQAVEYIFKRCNTGDWFLLYQFSKNVDGVFFKEICRDLMSNMHNNGF